MALASFRTASVFTAALGILVADSQAVDVRQVTFAQPWDAHTDVGTYSHPVWAADGQSIVSSARGILARFPGYEPMAFLIAFDLNGNLLPAPHFGIPNGDVQRVSPNPSQDQFAVQCWIGLMCIGVGVIDPRPDFPSIACLDGKGAPAWSPNGESIVVETVAGLQLFSPSGTPGALLTTRGDDKEPSWSPDGSSIVFTSLQGGSRDLWIKNIATGEQRQLTFDTESDTWPAWSPNGHWIAYATDRNGVNGIWAVPAMGGSPILITNFPNAEAPAPAWSPDGRSIAYESQGQIWVATNLPAVIVTVESRSWTSVKRLYGAGR